MVVDAFLVEVFVDGSCSGERCEFTDPPLARSMSA
jgi:hypothetical protein